MGAPTRQHLIEICERAALLQVSDWHDRDSARATQQLGEAWALLKAGCEFHAYQDDNGRTWWVLLSFPGFNAFEYGPDDTTTWDSERFYLPTAERLDAADGKDWY